MSRAESEAKLEADTKRLSRAVLEARAVARREKIFRSIETMISTARYAGRTPVRLVVSRLWNRSLREDAPGGEIQSFMGIPYEVDPETPVGFALVVR